MCDWCEKYGDPEHGDGFWYLNPRNYARNMYKLRVPGEKFKGAEAGMETGAREPVRPNQDDLIAAIEAGDGVEADGMLKVMAERARAGGGQPSQVIPLEHADKVLEICSPIAPMICMCRHRWRGVEERNKHEYSCMGMGVGMLKWERWPERYKGGVWFANIEEAKEWNHEMDRRGFVHILMTFGMPYIGGFCQCDFPDCVSIRGAVDFGLGSRRGHFVSLVDYDKCNGCGICASRCQFGALKFEVTTGKANIDQFKCFGCGLCKTGCPRDAINLVERKSIPTLAEVW